MNDQLKENVELAKSSDSFLFDNARIRPHRRYHESDSLRGVAALLVILPWNCRL